MKTVLLIFAVAACGLPADWLTFAGNPQRTGWARQENKISRENVKGLRLEWKLALDNAPKELTSLTAPVVTENVITPRGFKDIVVVAGSSDRLFAVDADTGKLLWQTRFTVEGAPRGEPHWLCPFGLNDTPVIDKRSHTVYVIASDGRLHSLNVVNGEDTAPPAQFVPPFSKNWSLNLVDGVLYTATSQGCNGARSGVWAMDIKDPKRPVRYFYAGPTGGAGIWGRAGVAIAPSGTVFAETGDGPYDVAAGKYSDTFLALSPGNLKLADYYTPTNHAWITKKDLDMGSISPVVFPFKQRELVAGGGKEGALFLLDAGSPGGADHHTPLFRSPLYTNDEVQFMGRGFWGALSTWQDEKGERWLYAPAWGPQTADSPKFTTTYGETPNGSIMAFRVEEQKGKPVLAPVWRSRNLSAPEPAIIANGLVFALSNGENVTQVDSAGRIVTTKFRAENPAGNAVLYALDAATGQELYSSGKTIPGWTHFSGLAMSNGRLYVVTHDSTLYAFGLGGRN